MSLSKTCTREERDGSPSGGRSKWASNWRPSLNAKSNRYFIVKQAWLHTLDEYVADTPLSQVILPLMRACFFDGATYAVLLAQKGHGNQVAADITGFITEQPRS